MAEWVEKGSIKGPPGEIPDVSDFLRDGDVSSAISGSSDKVASDKAVKDYVDTQVSSEATTRQEQDSLLQEQIGGKANAEHSHEMADVTGLNDKISEIETNIAGKADKAHTHEMSDVNGLDDALGAKANSTHTHAIADITDLQTELNGKADSAHTHADATGETSGFMSAADKTKLDGLKNTDMTGYVKVLRNYSGALQDDTGYIDTIMVTDDPMSGTNFVQIRTDGGQAVLQMNNMEVYGFTDVVEPDADGYHLATDKAVKNYVSENASKITVDSSLSDSSTNPVQNKVIKAAIDGKAASNHTHDDRYYTESEIDSKLDEKANATHTHTFDSSLSDSSTNAVQNKVVNSALAGKVPTTRTVNGKALSSNITLTASDVDADASGSANSALTQAKSYTDTKISALVNSAPETLDTLGELATAMTENADAIESLETIAASKANASDLTSHTGNTTVHITSTERTNWNAAKTHADTAHAPSNAEVNQNAFSNVKVGDVTIAADTKTDTLNLTAGSNVTITPNAETDTVTIAAKDTTYSVATTGANGLMSSADKTKLDGIASGANKYTHPTSAAGAKASGLYKITTDAQGHITAAAAVTKSDITALGIPAQDTNTTYKNATTEADGLMSSEDKTKLDGIASGANKTTVDSALSSTSTNPVQNKVINSALTGKASSSHTHNYAGSSSAGGSANSAVKLDTSAGSATQPVYFSGGKPVATTYTLNASVPSGAKFTDTTYSNMGGATTSADGKSGLVPAPTKGNANRYLRSDGTWTVPPDTNTTYTLSSFGITATAAELNKLDGVTATAAELNYVDGVTSNIQTQLNGKAASSHTHNYAGSSSAGGSANSAVKLDTSAGSATQPVYFSGGKPVATTYTLGASVPANAKFTDTTYSVMKGATSSAAGGTGLVPAPAAGKQTSFLRGDGTWVVPTNTNTTYDLSVSDISMGYNDSNTTIYGNSTEYTLTFTGSDGTNKKITIRDNAYKYDNATTSLDGLMSAEDKSKLNGIATGANKTTVDSALSSTSTNPVQNKVINSALAGKAASSHNHSAANITSGTLSADRLPVVSIAKGGTGANNAATARTNLGITFASDTDFKAYMGIS